MSRQRYNVIPALSRGHLKHLQYSLGLKYVSSLHQSDFCSLHAEEVAPGGGAGLFGVIPSRDSRYVRPMGYHFGQRMAQRNRLYGLKKVFHINIDQPLKADSRVQSNLGNTFIKYCILLNERKQHFFSSQTQYKDPRQVLEHKFAVHKSKNYP